MNIAIVGMAGVFPGADNTEQFWKNLCEGKDTVTRSGEPVQCEGYMKINAYGSIRDMYRFDAEFFSMTERDAAETDPQERFMMMLAQHALEDAGIVPDDDENRIGLVCGAKENEYALHRYYDTGLSGIERETAKMYLGASLATRTAYKLDLQGPVVQLRATCATGLAAAHLACGFLNSKDADVMLAGAVNLSPQHKFYAYMDGGITSADGHGRAFSEEASGCVPGDGAAVVVLKRYEDAVRDHDRIYAVIRGSALRNDGNIKMGFSAPSRTAEIRTIRDALNNAGILPEEVDIVETHGTATRLGDMVELGSLQRIFKPEQKLILGAVKNNIGHLNYAAGIAGLIKTALILKHKTVPPVVNSTSICKAALDHNFVLNKECISLEGLHPERPLTAGVSSFGIGGNNVHMVLQAYEGEDKPSVPQEKMLFFLSAKTQASLDEYEKEFTEWLKANLMQWQNAAYTLCTGRRTMACRSILYAENKNGSITVRPYETPFDAVKAEKFTLNRFTADELEQAAGTFLAGGKITVGELDDGSSLHKISLPYYCFAETSYNLFKDDDAVNEEIQKTSAESDTASPEETVKAAIEEVTGCGFSPEDDIDAIGLDSLTFVIVCSKLEARFGVSCASMDLFAYDTIGGLIKDIVDMIDEEQTQNKEHHTENEHEQTIEDLLDMIS
jgi:acyl transferase domain-containing protein/acyl carrier protein